MKKIILSVVAFALLTTGIAFAVGHALSHQKAEYKSLETLSFEEMIDRAIELKTTYGEGARGIKTMTAAIADAEAIEGMYDGLSKHEIDKARTELMYACVAYQWANASEAKPYFMGNKERIIGGLYKVGDGVKVKDNYEGKGAGVYIKQIADNIYNVEVEYGYMAQKQLNNGEALADFESIDDLRDAVTIEMPFEMEGGQQPAYEVYYIGYTDFTAQSVLHLLSKDAGVYLNRKGGADGTTQHALISKAMQDAITAGQDAVEKYFTMPIPTAEVMADDADVLCAAIWEARQAEFTRERFLELLNLCQYEINYVEDNDLKDDFAERISEYAPLKDDAITAVELVDAYHGLEGAREEFVFNAKSILEPSTSRLNFTYVAKNPSFEWEDVTVGEQAQELNDWNVEGRVKVIPTAKDKMNTAGASEGYRMLAVKDGTVLTKEISNLRSGLYDFEIGLGSVIGETTMTVNGKTNKIAAALYSKGGTLKVENVPVAGEHGAGKATIKIEIKTASTVEWAYLDNLQIMYKATANAIIIEDGITGGTVTTVPEGIGILGETVNIFATPAEGYEVLHYHAYYMDGDEQVYLPVVIPTDKSKAPHFTMPNATVYVKACFAPKEDGTMATLINRAEVIEKEYGDNAIGKQSMAVAIANAKAILEQYQSTDKQDVDSAYIDLHYSTILFQLSNASKAHPYMVTDKERFINGLYWLVADGAAANEMTTTWPAECEQISGGSNEYRLTIPNGAIIDRLTADASKIMSGDIETLKNDVTIPVQFEAGAVNENLTAMFIGYDKEIATSTLNIVGYCARIYNGAMNLQVPVIANSQFSKKLADAANIAAGAAPSEPMDALVQKAEDVVTAILQMRGVANTYKRAIDLTKLATDELTNTYDVDSAIEDNLKDAISKSTQSLEDESDAVEFIKTYAALDKVRQDLVKFGEPATGYPYDVTVLYNNNPSFEQGNKTGWDITGNVIKKAMIDYPHNGGAYWVAGTSVSTKAESVRSGYYSVSMKVYNAENVVLTVNGKSSKPSIGSPSGSVITVDEVKADDNNELNISLTCSGVSGSQKSPTIDELKVYFIHTEDPNVIYVVAGKDITVEENKVKKHYNPGDAITIDDNYDYFEVTENIKNMDITYKRKFQNNDWQPWFMPFKIAAVEDSLITGVKYAKISGTRSDEDPGKAPYVSIQRVKVGENVNASTPYFIACTEPASKEAPVYAELKFNATLRMTGKPNLNDLGLPYTDQPDGIRQSVHASSPEYDFKFYGVYEIKAQVDGGKPWYYFSKGLYYSAPYPNPNPIYRAYPFRHFMTIDYISHNPYEDIDDGIGAKIEFVEVPEGGETTGINGVKSTIDMNNGYMYNMQGVRVGANYKGVVIMNGKKFINK